MELPVSHSPRKEHLARHIFPNRLAKKEDAEKANQNKSCPTLPVLPDLPSVPSEPSPKPLDHKAEHKKEHRPLSKSQSMPKLKRDSISFRGRVADGIVAPFQSKSEKEEAKEKDKTPSRSVRIMLSDDELNKEHSKDHTHSISASLSVGSTDSFSSSANNLSSSDYSLSSSRPDSVDREPLQPHPTPLATLANASPSKSKHRFLARTPSRETGVGEVEKDTASSAASEKLEKSSSHKLKRTNSEKSNFMILEFRAKHLDARAELMSSGDAVGSKEAKTQPVSPRGHVTSSGSARETSVTGKTLADSLPLSLPSHVAEKTGSRASLRIIRYASSLLFLVFPFLFLFFLCFMLFNFLHIYLIDYCYVFV
jgi:hypothetical protein